MPVHIHIEEDLDLTVLTFTRPLTFEELLSTVQKVWEEESTTINGLWLGEFGATAADFTMEQIAKIATMFTHYSDKLPRMRGGKTAIVAPNDLDFGLSRMGQSLHDSTGQAPPYEMRVFRSEKEARRWLAG